MSLRSGIWPIHHSWRLCPCFLVFVYAINEWKCTNMGFMNSWLLYLLCIKIANKFTHHCPEIKCVSILITLSPIQYLPVLHFLMSCIVLDTQWIILSIYWVLVSFPFRNIMIQVFKKNHQLITFQTDFTYSKSFNLSFNTNSYNWPTLFPPINKIYRRYIFVQ